MFPILSDTIPLLRDNLCPNFLILYLHAHNTSFNFSTEIFNEGYESAEASYKEGDERGSTVNGHQIRAISPVHLAFGETVLTATFLSTGAVSANYIPMKLVFFWSSHSDGLLPRVLRVVGLQQMHRGHYLSYQHFHKTVSEASCVPSFSLQFLVHLSWQLTACL